MGTQLILIVDADPAWRAALAAILAGAGCDSVGVATAEEGLSLMGGAAFPVAMTGLGLPGMDGIGFLAEARRLHPATEVILVPEAASLESAVSALRAGACDYLPKPFPDPAIVHGAVARAVEKGRIARESRVQFENLAQKNEILLATNQFLAEQVKRDGLTGLYNHRHLQEALAREVARATRYNRVFSLLFADIDHFKQYNDNQGHLAGDKALRAIAELLRKSVRNSDFVARYGGEEFAVLLPETDKERARIVAERILYSVERHPFPGREAQPGGRLTISIGLSAFPDDGGEPAELLRRADEALYEAKRDGGNAFCLAG
jgi:diguanylate cyclase (GGDEF)-like protein